MPRQVRHSDTSQLPLIASGKSFNLNNPSYGSNTHRVYVNLPPDASFIREDGSFIDTSSVISIDSLPQAALNAPRGSIQNQTAVHQSTAFAPAPVPAAGQLGQGLSSQISNVMNDSTVTTISPAFHEQNHPSVHLQGQEGQLGRMTDEGPFIQAALHTDHQTFNEPPPPPPSSRSNNPSVPCNLNDLKNLLDPTQTTLLNQLRKHATSERFVPFSKNSIAGRNVNQQAQQQQQQQLQQLQLQVQLQQQQAQQQLVTIDHLTQQPLVRHLSSGDFSSGGFNVTNTGAFVTDESAHYDLNQATQSVGQVVFSAERLMTESASSMAGAVVFSFGDEPSPHTFPSQQDAECTINPFDSFVHHHHPHHHHHHHLQQQQQQQQQLQQQQQQHQLQLQQPPQNPYQE